VPAEGAAEHLRTALAILRAQIERGALAGDLALDLRAAMAHLERAVEVLSERGPVQPRVTPAALGHVLSVTLELVWPTSCVRLADAWRGAPTVAELLAHWQSCTSCHADAGRATARILRRSWD